MALPTPKVSIIIPVYGVEKYIAAAVQSALDQTYQDFELIIVNNNTPDRSIEICQEFDDPRIQIIHQENRGPAGSRNTGIRHAQGAYITFLDGDDLWEPEKLAKHVAHLDRSPAVGISYCYSEFIDEVGDRLGMYMTPRLNNITPGYVLCRCPMGNGSVSVYRREVFEDIRFEDTLHGSVEDFYFNERMRNLEDVECWLRMALQTRWVMEGIPEVLTLYRINTQGSSANIERHLQYLDRLVETVRVYAPEFMDKWEAPFRAYQLRYLARRMVTLEDGKMATKLMQEAIATHWRIFLEEPRRTGVSLAASYVLRLLPRSVFTQTKGLALQIASKLHRHEYSQQAKLTAAPPKALEADLPVTHSEQASEPTPVHPEVSDPEWTTIH